MEGTYFFSGITVESDDLNNVQDVLSKQIKERALDFFSKGILGKTSDVYVVNGLKNTINIQPFTALTPAGERVKVYKTIKSLALDLRNQETEHRLSQQGEIPDEYFGWTPNIYYDIYVNYIEAYGSPRAHITSGEFYPTRVNPGFEFYALRSEDPVVNAEGEPYLVKIAQVFYDGQALQIYTVGNMDVSTIEGSKIKTTPTTTKTTYYAPTYNPTTLQDHVMCIGSGTPTEKNPHGLSLSDFGADASSVHDHERTLHSSGIIADRSSTESALFIQLNHRTLNGETDSLILYNFTEGEFVQHRGNHANYIYKEPAANTYTKFELVFRSGSYGTGTALADGTYIIGVDVVNKTLVGGFIPTVNGTSTSQIITVYALNTDDARGEEVGQITTMSMEDYNLQNYFDLAKFEFRQIKEPTTIQADVDSNFLTKVDLRLFGSVTADNLQTSKYTTNEVYGGVAKTEDMLDYSKYLVKVKTLTLASGVVLDGSSVLPSGYMSGFKITRLDDTRLLIGPGACRDASNSMDLKLNTAITKTFTSPWLPGGFSSATTGGLVPDILPENMAYRDYHIFIIGRGSDGAVDVAFDTDPSGYNILLGTSTTAIQGYTFVRRVGSFYTVKNSTDNVVLTQFTTIPTGSTLKVIMPNYNLDFGATTYAARTVIPAGIPVIGHFTYRDLRSTFGLHSSMETRTVYYVSGSGLVDILLNNGTLYIDKNLNADDSVLYNVGMLKLTTGAASVSTGTTTLVQAGPAQSVQKDLSSKVDVVKSGTDFVATRMNGVGEIISCIGYTDLRGE